MVGKRADSDGHRARQAQATREMVAVTARRLFAERGYVATTIAAIAESSGVPAQTIYSSLGGKAGVLEEIRRLWIADSGAALTHREALAEADLATRLRMAAGWHRRQVGLGDDVITVYQEAARSAPDMAREWERVLRGREGAITELVRSLAGGLASGLDVKTATDVFVAPTLSEMYRTLVVHGGWSLDEFEQCLADTLIAQLLG